MSMILTLLIRLYCLFKKKTCNKKLLCVPNIVLGANNATVTQGVFPMW